MKAPNHSPSPSVFISALLPHRFPSLAGQLSKTFGGRLGLIEGTRDIWCRDYLPVQVAPGRFVRFRYRPDYLDGQPDIRTDPAVIPIPLSHCRQSRLVIDGGNVLRLGNTAIVTAKVFRENPRHGRAAVRKLLRRQLEVEHLIVIPPEPGDVLGHADGVLRFVDARTVLVNDYRRVDPDYGRRLKAVLRRHRLEMVPCPYAPTDDVGQDGIPSAVGVYVNFLVTADMLVCPTYGLPQDATAIRLLKRCYPTRRIEPVRCRKLAAEGGAINCVTWNIEPGP